MSDRKRPTNIGGQAVIEGVMMRGKKIYAMAVRNPEGEIVVEKKPVGGLGKKGLFRYPIFRGMAAFVDSLVTGTKILMRSAEIAGEGWEEEELSPFEQWLKEKLGDKINLFQRIHFPASGHGAVFCAARCHREFIQNPCADVGTGHYRRLDSYCDFPWLSLADFSYEGD